MIKYHYDIEQGSDAWHALRCGIVTASIMKNFITAKTLKTAANEKTRSIIYELAAQRITNYVEPEYIGYDMMRGHEEEAIARDLYSAKIWPVKQCGFITREIDGIIVGYSPDGLIEDDGGIEVKSRDHKFQVQTIIADAVPDEFMIQLQTGLFTSGRKWIEFISYSGGLPMFTKLVEPIAEYQDAIYGAIIESEKQIKETIDKFQSNKKLYRFLETPITKRETEIVA